MTAAAKDLIIEEGYDPQFGARPMRRAIQRLVQDPLALKLLDGEFRGGRNRASVDASPERWASRIRQSRLPVAV